MFLMDASQTQRVTYPFVQLAQSTTTIQAIC